MSRTATLLMACAFVVPVAMYAQSTASKQGTTKPSTGSQTAAKPAMKKTDAQLIADAASAAPANISKGATIMNWPETPTGQPRQLRAGTNGWVCYPSSPMEFKDASVGDPMCMDKAWQGWADAWLKKAAGPPRSTSSGIAYMLRGDKGASNSDPFAEKETATNNWVVSPPHIMVLYPDVKSLDAFSADPKNGGPWVMWKGTPYAHLMVPVSTTKGAMMGMGK
jgi:hypothetical protein